MKLSGSEVKWDTMSEKVAMAGVIDAFKMGMPGASDFTQSRVKNFIQI